MVIMSPGAFPDTSFPDRYWIDDYWANYDLFTPVDDILNLDSYINILEDINSDINIIIDDRSDITRLISKFSETNSEIVVTRYSELIT